MKYDQILKNELAANSYKDYISKTTAKIDQMKNSQVNYEKPHNSRYNMKHTEELNAWTAICAGLYKVQQQVKINYAI